MDPDELNQDTSIDGQDPDAAPSGPWPLLLMGLWLVALGMLIFFIPMLLISGSIGQEVERVQADINFAQQTVIALDTPPAESQALVAERDQARANAAALSAAYNQVLASFIPWPDVIRAIENYDGGSLQLTSMQQSDLELTLRGRAADDTSVVDYARRLEASDLFERVVVRSIRAVEEPWVTPLPTAEVLTPTVVMTATATATPDLRDAYELDDFEPNELFLATTQQHSFYPEYDVDTLRFLAKVGRYYRVYTSDLAEGVDTFLTVAVGEASYSSDDRGVGDLASEVVFMGGTAYDSDALITVTNRGEYGPDKAYKITIKEIVPTATLIPTETPIPSGTPVPTTTITPTPTDVPTVTITPTPNLADDFEPDDTTPSFIGVGETQTHTFYPSNDVDKAKFLAKDGRTYRVATSQLAIGVDTLLFVQAGPDAYTNDDRVEGTQESMVEFTVSGGYDVEVTVEVLNRGAYGAGMKYLLTVVELVVAPTATAPPPSATPDLRDSYEPDETVPSFFAVGDAQSHTFYPDGDVDQVAFLAKANRFYYVQTSSLALGVDTYLTAAVPGVPSPLVNDDRQPGDPSSALTIAIGASDVTVIVQVTNRGRFDSNASYSLSIQEVIITPVPTSTPDSLGDSFEPDDAIPKAIAVGDTQTHTFYPDGDIDQLAFLGKSGRTYQVSTINLAVGVDTVLTANVNGVIHSNDDRSGAPPGDYASDLTFAIPAGSDIVVGLAITNKGLFGTGASYSIRVVELTTWATPDVMMASLRRAPGLAAALPWDALPLIQRGVRSDPALLRLQDDLPAEPSGAVEFVIVLDVAPAIEITPTAEPTAEGTP